ncbi:MAG: methylated-DNA--[protein]-cysteine S-methyltransferase, partial [Alphaproteobacteria bacterium]|nr:methylated-DNA--[protein]-cysteine S-methyltransferase [Alphaproteobacteria bacterium]
TLHAALIHTKLGEMIAIANEAGLYLLEFVCSHRLERKIANLEAKLHATIVEGMTPPIQSIARELELYFSGDLKTFSTPVHIMGTPFQQAVWKELMRIPYGKTCSYMHQAQSIGKPQAHRAVANANGANQLAVIIPCHRIIQANGDLGGYGGGIKIKQWLLEHEGEHV